MRLRNKVALITGGAQGIGRATAECFIAEGATVIVADIKPTSLEGASSVVADVAQADQVAQMFRAIHKIDILVCNAGRPYRSTSLTASDSDWEECLALNLKSAWLCAREAHGLLSASGNASIVTVASAQGQRSAKNSFPYSAAKGGLLALTRTLAVEYAPTIRVNAIIPGQIESVRTEPLFESFPDPAEARRRVLATFPMKRLGKPEDVAKAILFLASDDAAWITGIFLQVDGGRDAALLDLSDLEQPG